MKFKSNNLSKSDSTSSTLVNSKAKINEGEGLNYYSTVEEIEANDLEAWEGVDLFFKNEFDKAQLLFKKRSETDFLYALCYGATCLFKAGLTLQEEHINLAIETLTKANNLAQQTIDKIQQIEGNTMINSISKAFGGFFSSSSSNSGSRSSDKVELPKISPLEFRAQICKAESCLLIGNLQLMMESWTYYMKAVLNLHSGFSIYHSLDKYIDAYANNAENPPYDKHSLSGYYFGVGTINIIINMLPPKIATLIGTITGKIDAQKGFSYISKSIEMNGLLSILSNFQGSMIHLLYFSFCPSFSIPKNIEELKPYLNPAIEKYPDGFFFRLIMGRRDRALKNLELSDSHYYTIAGSKGAWNELTSMSNYELSFNNCFTLNWQKANQLFENLTIREYWNPTIFTYLQAICQFELGNLEICKEKLKSIETLQTRKFGGKTIAVEAFALAKTKYYLQKFPQNITLPGLEVIALWNGFSTMSRENLEKCKQQSSEVLENILKLPESDRFEEESLCYYLLGCIELELENYSKATEYLTKIQSFKKKLKLNQYIVAFSYYELACVEFKQTNYNLSKSWLTKVKECSGYFFENRLSIRVHLSNIQLRTLC